MIKKNFFSNEGKLSVSFLIIDDIYVVGDYDGGKN